MAVLAEMVLEVGFCWACLESVPEVGCLGSADGGGIQGMDSVRAAHVVVEKVIGV